MLEKSKIGKKNQVLRDAVMDYMNKHQLGTIKEMAEKLDMPRRTLSSWIGGMDGHCDAPFISEDKFDAVMLKFKDKKDCDSSKQDGSPYSFNKEQIITSVAGDILKIFPLIELVLSDNFTEEDREKIRSRAGGDGVFMLANALDRLCGPRARKTTI